MNSDEHPIIISICSFVLLTFSELRLINFHDHTRTTKWTRVRQSATMFSDMPVILDIALPVSPFTLKQNRSGRKVFCLESSVGSNILVLPAGAAVPNKSIGRLGGQAWNQGHCCRQSKELFSSFFKKRKSRAFSRDAVGPSISSRRQ